MALRRLGKEGFYLGRRMECLRSIHSSVMVQAKGKGKKQAAKAKTKKPGQLSLEHATGINIYKEGSDPPLGKPEDYPEWLWKLLEPEPTLSALERKAYQEGFNEIEEREFRRLFDLANRKRIRRQNMRAGAGKSS